MITPEEKEKIINTLGNHYSSTIINHLSNKSILNTDNNNYSANSIRQFVNGERSNENVEFEIMKLVEKTINKTKRQQEFRKKIIEK